MLLGECDWGRMLWARIGERTKPEGTSPRGGPGSGQEEDDIKFGLHLWISESLVQVGTTDGVV